MKFGNCVADIFIIKHTQFGYDAFGFAISIVNCLGLQFFVDTVYILTQREKTLPP